MICRAAVVWREFIVGADERLEWARRVSMIVDEKAAGGTKGRVSAEHGGPGRGGRAAGGTWGANVLHVAANVADRGSLFFCTIAGRLVVFSVLGQQDSCSLGTCLGYALIGREGIVGRRSRVVWKLQGRCLGRCLGYVLSGREGGAGRRSSGRGWGGGSRRELC